MLLPVLSSESAPPTQSQAPVPVTPARYRFLIDLQNFAVRQEQNFEDRNFTLFDPHQVFGYTRVERPLLITDPDGHDVTDDILRVEEGRIYLNNTLMPAMITYDKLVVRQDCLCYLLQDYLG